MKVFANHVGRSKLATALLLAAAFMFSAAPSARAQEVNVAEVDGHVTDPSGASVVGATVKMTDVETHQVHTFTTDNGGSFRFPNLPIGAYILEVSAQGFKLYRQTGIILEVAHNVEQNVALQVGATSETVEVTANANMVETKDSAISQVMEERKLVDLPLNGRNLTQLLTLTGGGTSTPSGDLTGSKNMGGSNGSGTFSVAGSQANGISYLLDGGDNNDTFSNVNLPIPFPDAVQEFSVQTNAMQAQFGLHPGGAVNIVTKSGTNAFHGDLFDFLRNYELNARPKGAIPIGGTSSSANQPVRDSLKRNQFGGVVGGKIKKDKLFFFAGYQQTVQRSNPSQTTAHVPTALTLAGNFSVEDAATSAGGCQKSAIVLKDPSGNPFPGNIIPSSRFDPAALKLLSYIPVSTDNCGAFTYGQLSDNPDWQVIGRVDYVRSEKHTLYGRYFIYNYTAQAFFDGKDALTTGPNPGNKEQSETVTFGDTYLFSPTAVNSFHATYNRRADNRGSAPNLFGPQSLGIKNTTGGPFADNMPDNYIQVTVGNYFNVACGTCAPGYFNVNNYQLSDDFSWIKGKHQLAFGFDGRKDQFNETANQQSNGQWTFSGGSTSTYSGDNLADLLMGHMSTWNQGNALSDYIRQNVFAFYVQDTWHATDHLTVNIGARWEPLQPAYDKYCRGNWLDMAAYQAGVRSTQYPGAPIGLIFGHDSQNVNGCGFTQHHWGDTSPRLGLVWDPTGEGKQSLRAGFGLLHDTTELFYPERWTTNPPYASAITLTNPPITAPFSNPWNGYVSPTGVAGDPFPGVAIFPSLGTYVSVPPNMHATYVLQWNVSYQRQIAKDWLATATYIGNRTNHVYGSYDINAPQNVPGATASNEQARRVLSLINPTAGGSYAQIVQSDDGASGTYEGLLLKLEHRFSHHFTWLANYTWSQCISTYDFGGELAGPIYQNQSNRDAEKADCNFDRRQIYGTSAIFESPGLGAGVVRGITKDWQVAPLVSLYTGQPITITTGSDVSLTGENLDRPNVVSGVSPYPHTLTAWFNPSLFAGGCNNATYASNPSCVPLGTFGDEGRDAIRNPGTIQWDMSVSRIFRFSERLKLQYKSEFFNIMNHANWNGPAGTSSTLALTSATFGQMTSFGSPRLIQMSLKMFF